MTRNLVTAFNETGMTQQTFADLSGVSVRAVQKWLRGDSTPSDPKLRVIAELFEKDLVWFYRDNDPVEEAAA